jgi:ABC-type sulfate/molybdate transport systems ATPase subunit
LRLHNGQRQQQLTAERRKQQAVVRVLFSHKRYKSVSIEKKIQERKITFVVGTYFLFPHFLFRENQI